MQSPSSLSQSSVITSSSEANADECVKFDTVEEALGDFRPISLGTEFFFAIVFLEGGEILLLWKNRTCIIYQHLQYLQQNMSHVNLFCNESICEVLGIAKADDTQIQMHN